MSAAGFDPDTISAEQFAALVGTMGDAQLLSAVQAIGVGRVLDRVFDQMRARFRPEHAAGVDAESQFVIRDGTEEHPYVVAIRGGQCAIRRERAAASRVTLVADLLSYLRLVTGNAEGATLFMTGKLRVAGDLVFSLRLLSFFDRPKPA